MLQGVTFASGRSVLTEESFATLDEVAASLQAHPEIRIEIAGHTDATGSAEVNTRLSLARARAVMMYLARQGVSPERMVAQGYGPDRPIAPNGTAEGRARNRRVELSIIGILPEFQGQGFGGGLVGPVLNRADQSGVPTYLETFTPRNITFYN